MPRSLLAAATAVTLVVGASPARLYAQKENKEEISFKTYDGVLIKGTYYPSNQGGKSPTVILLHKYGSDRTKGDWDGLAKRLQEKGNNVMSFDFRGHGGSTVIADPEKFWAYPGNTKYIKGGTNPGITKKKTITFKDFAPGYLPYLVNDIVAARWDLDNRNDNGQCNTSNIIVIGAEEGGALGLLWMTTEGFRRAVYSKMNAFDFNPGNTATALDDIAGAIFLSYTRTPYRTSFPYRRFVELNGKLRERVPMWFTAGSEDKEGVSDSEYMYKTIFHAEKLKDKLPLTSNVLIKGVKLRGIQLVGTGKLDTDDLIEKFIKKASEQRPNTAQKKRNASDSEPYPVPLAEFGFANYP
jgi:pimeloyl-ACP methyl ester carboxylesterase